MLIKVSYSVCGHVVREEYVHHCEAVNDDDVEGLIARVNVTDVAVTQAGSPWTTTYTKVEGDT